MNGLARGIAALVGAVGTVLAVSLVTSCGPCPNPSTAAPSDCVPDVPSYAGLFTSPPTDIANIDSVLPLGHLNPGGGHALQSDHMYLLYNNQSGDGSQSIAVHAMAPGKLFMIFQIPKTDQPAFYQVFIRYTCSVYSYYAHVHALSTRINDYLVNNKVPWLGLGTGANVPKIAFLGQANGPPMLSLDAGEQVGTSTNYTSAWDVGVVDTRREDGDFATPDTPHAPGLDQYIKLFPDFDGIDVTMYHLGSLTRNAACFIDYMDDSTGMRTEWFDKLSSTPKGCGHTGWYLPGKLQGEWFNPRLTALQPTLDFDTAGMSILPDSQNPCHQVLIAVGNAKNGTVTPSLAALDPSTWSPPISAPQIGSAFPILFDATPAATIDPDPANVGAATMVCYDLPVNPGGFNSMLLYMKDSTHLEIKFDPAVQTSAQCATLMAASPTVDTSWIEYVR